MPQLLTNHLIRLGHLASLVSSMTPMFDELDLFPSPRIEDDVKTSPIWHSPLYCPSGTYVGAKTPRNSTEALTAELCRNVQSWLGTFEGVGDESGEESMLPYRQHCRQAIALFRPYAGSSTSESGYVYECCRLVAHLMLRAEALHCSLKKAVLGASCFLYFCVGQFVQLEPDDRPVELPHWQDRNLRLPRRSRSETATEAEVVQRDMPQQSLMDVHIFSCNILREISSRSCWMEPRKTRTVGFALQYPGLQHAPFERLIGHSPATL
jgi:hypothetical protein